MNDGELLIDSEITHMYTKNIGDFQYILSSSINDIYFEAFDGDNIDETKALDIFNKYALKKSNINIKELLHSSIQNNMRSENIETEVNENDFFSESQAELINQLLGYDKVDIILLNNLRERALLLDNNERDLILYIIDVIKISIKEVDNYISEDNDSYFRAKNTNVTFACNLGAGMVGFVSGFLAGALTGSVTGPGGLVVGGVVSTVVSAYISTHAC